MKKIEFDATVRKHTGKFATSTIESAKVNSMKLLPFAGKKVHVVVTLKD